MATPVLEMRNVEKNFGGVRAIDNFSVTLEPGKIHGLIGPNGAGKTTIFNNITGIYAPDSGKIIFNGTDMLIAAHCEDQETIKNNIAKYKEMFAGENDIPIGKHPYIRSSAACYASSELAVRLARIAGARLHILHVSTAKELQLFNDYSLSEKHITAEACVAHLLFTLSDYRTLGTRIKCNPAIKKQADRDALRAAVNSGLIDVIATDHAPHTAEEKSRGLAGSAMGIVGLECAFPLLYTYLVKPGLLTLEQLVERMSMAPRRIFGLGGGLQAGEPADLTVFDLDAEYEIDPETFLSKGRATPFAGWRVAGRTLWTLVGGRTAYATERFR